MNLKDIRDVIGWDINPHVIVNESLGLRYYSPCKVTQDSDALINIIDEGYIKFNHEHPYARFYREIVKTKIWAWLA